MADETRKRAEILAEMAALEERIKELRPEASASSPATGPLTRRQALGAWIAPVLMTFPVQAAASPTTRRDDRAASEASDTATPTTVVPTTVVPTTVVPTTAVSTAEMMTKASRPQES